MSGVSKANDRTFRPCKETFKAIKAEKIVPEAFIYSCLQVILTSCSKTRKS